MKTPLRYLAWLAALAMSGCMSTSPQWDARFGESKRMLTAQQIIAPDAAFDTDPVAGIDGKAAQATMAEYAKSYAQPEPQPNLFTIGVGNGGGR